MKILIAFLVVMSFGANLSLGDEEEIIKKSGIFPNPPQEPLAGILDHVSGVPKTSRDFNLNRIARKHDVYGHSNLKDDDSYYDAAPSFSPGYDEPEAASEEGGAGAPEQTVFGSSPFPEIGAGLGGYNASRRFIGE